MKFLYYSKKERPWTIFRLAQCRRENCTTYDYNNNNKLFLLFRVMTGFFFFKYYYPLCARKVINYYYDYAGLLLDVRGDGTLRTEFPLYAVVKNFPHRIFGGVPHYNRKSDFFCAPTESAAAV